MAFVVKLDSKLDFHYIKRKHIYQKVRYLKKYHMGTNTLIILNLEMNASGHKLDAGFTSYDLYLALVLEL